MGPRSESAGDLTCRVAWGLEEWVAELTERSGFDAPHGGMVLAAGSFAPESPFAAAMDIHSPLEDLNFSQTKTTMQIAIPQPIGPSSTLPTVAKPEVATAVPSAARSPMSAIAANTMGMIGSFDSTYKLKPSRALSSGTRTNQPKAHSVLSESRGALQTRTPETPADRPAFVEAQDVSMAHSSVRQRFEGVIEDTASAVKRPERVSAVPASVAMALVLQGLFDARPDPRSHAA